MLSESNHDMINALNDSKTQKFLISQSSFSNQYLKFELSSDEKNSAQMSR
mgnify:CR=1 FL=1